MEYDRISDLRDPASRDHGGGADDLERDVMRDFGEMETQRKIGLMHILFGFGEGKCSECRHFGWFDPPPYWTCGIYGSDRCLTTQWRPDWQSCGLYDKECNLTGIWGLTSSNNETKKVVMTKLMDYWSVMP